MSNLRSNSIFRALCLSLLFHFIVFSVLELGYGLKLWNHSILHSKALAELRDKNKTAQLKNINKPKEELEIPLSFVEIDPSQASPEPPKDSAFYSTQNTLASNPDIRLEKEVPKIDGKQDHVPRTFDTPKPQPIQPAPPPPKEEPAKTEPKPEPAPLQPAPPAEAKPPPTPAPVAVAEQKPPEAVEAGDLNVGKPNEKTVKPKETQKDSAKELAMNSTPAPPAQHVRPRTLAAARQQLGISEGEKMKQEGGAKRFSLQPNFDVKSSPFGAYDDAFFAAVKARWFSLLAERDIARDEEGKVVLEFRLNKDGRITAMQVAENSVSDTLSWICQRAVFDPAPYAPFPADLRRLLAADYRLVKITFFYSQY